MIGAGLVYQGKPSKRALALLLADGRADDRRVVDDYRKQVGRWLRGGQRGVQQRTAEMLAEALDTPIDYWPISRPDLQPGGRAIDVAEDLLRRLDAGEQVPRNLLDRVAVQVDETADLCVQLAGRLRAGGEAVRSGA